MTHSRAKITPEEVLEIRRRAAAGVTRGVLAHDYGVSLPTISQIMHRKTWKHLEEGTTAMSNAIPKGMANDDHVNRGPGKKDLIRVYRDRAGDVRWKRQRANGRVISDSGEGYKHRRDALDGLYLANRDTENYRLVDHTDTEEDYDHE